MSDIQTAQGLQAIVKDGVILKFGTNLDAEADALNAEIFAVQDGQNDPTDPIDNPAYTHAVYDADESIILFADTRIRCDEWCENHNGKVTSNGGDPCYYHMPIQR